MLRADRAITGLLKDFCLDFSFGLLCIVTLFYKAGFLCFVRITGEQVVDYRIFVQFFNFLCKLPLQGFQAFDLLPQERRSFLLRLLLLLHHVLRLCHTAGLLANGSGNGIQNL